MICPTAIPAEATSQEAQAGVVVTSGGNLNVRSNASTGANVVKTLANGSHITLRSKSGNWWKVEYGRNQIGYCYADYIRPVSSETKQVNLTSGSLNVRSGPGTSYGKIGSLSKGDTVTVLSSSAGWSRILYHGTMTGYVSDRYLKNGTDQVYAKVSLAVPSFKQTDSRWANVSIGNSGKTMAQIGCATTAIAMIESWRMGKTIFPDTMSRQLSYTSSGSVYWPANYTAVSDSGYLSGIYHQLAAGKAVLFGARTSSGKQHWVVITGFSGGDVLTPSGFMIHDPGSNSRTNLQQFLNDYPVFYKYFRY